MNLPRLVIHAGEHRIDAYVARSAAERALGLMHRSEMEADEGMLFMCDEPARQSFWMKDTPLDLSIAFIEDDGTIVQLGDLQAQSLEPHACRQPVRFILEVPRGWFAERGIAEGMRLQGPVFLAGAEPA